MQAREKYNLGMGKSGVSRIVGSINSTKCLMY